MSAPYDALRKSIRKAEYQPVYWLQGIETYFIDQLANLLQKYVVPEQEKDFAEKILYGKEVQWTEVLDLARQLPMLGERQLIVLRQAQECPLNSTAIKALELYLENPPEHTILVVLYRGKNLSVKSSRLNKLLTPWIFTSHPIREWNIEAYIGQTLTARKIEFGSKIPALLAEHIGTDLSLLHQELDKLELSLPENRVLDEILLENQIGISREFNLFELQDALAQHKWVRALELAYHIETSAEPQALVRNIGGLYTFFSNLLLVKTQLGTPPAHIAKDLGMQEFMVKKLMIIAAKFSYKNLTGIINLLADFDLKSKGIGSTSDQGLLRELIFKIILTCKNL